MPPTLSNVQVYSFEIRLQLATYRMLRSHFSENYGVALPSGKHNDDHDENDHDNHQDNLNDDHNNDYFEGENENDDEGDNN